MRAGDDVDRAAVAAVAAARAAARHELLAAERQAAASAVSGRDVDVDFVDEHRNLVIGDWRSGNALTRSPDHPITKFADYSTGMMLMTRPCAP